MSHHHHHHHPDHHDSDHRHPHSHGADHHHHHPDHEADHDHSHHEQPIKSGGMSVDEKLIKLFDHWIRHNTDHVQSYRDWAKQAKENNWEPVGILLEEVAEASLAINRKFEEAARLIKGG